MQNNYLDLLSALQEVLEQEANLIDEKLAEYDDGNFRSVKDSRELIIADCENAIESLQTLKKEMEAMPMKKITEKYLG